MRFWERFKDSWAIGVDVCGARTADRNETYVAIVSSAYCAVEYNSSRIYSGGVVKPYTVSDVVKELGEVAQWRSGYKVLFLKNMRRVAVRAIDRVRERFDARKIFVFYDQRLVSSRRQEIAEAAYRFLDAVIDRGGIPVGVLTLSSAHRDFKRRDDGVHNELRRVLRAVYVKTQHGAGLRAEFPREVPVSSEEVEKAVYIQSEDEGYPTVLLTAHDLCAWKLQNWISENL